MNVLVAGRYRLDDRIAVGGMGEVWRAVDTVLARPVAVKLLRAEYAGHRETLARFRAEARHAASLSHPGIAQVYDYGETGEGHPPYLVMELVDGPSLTGLLAGGPLDAATTMDVIAQAAAALQVAHSAGLVHRDIKPGNLLVSPGGQVKITDFGIANAAGSAPITRTGTLIGTPAYLAPERLSGASATTASDLYALGIVAWECLSGTPPFAGLEIEMALAHRDLPLPPLPPGVPAEVAAIIAELAAKDPAARPASARAAARRAARLRDALGASALAGSWPDTQPARSSAPHAATLAGADNPTLAGADHPTVAGEHRPTLTGGPLAAPRVRLHRGSRPRRTVALAVAAAAAIAVLAAWLLPGMLGSTAARQHVDTTTVVPAATRTPAGMVAVNESALIGQPVAAVRRQLRQLGLQARLAWQPADQQPAGTVLSVQPAGQVPVGSTVIVTAAFQGPGRHAGRSHGHGNGDGNGGGGNGGGDGDGNGGGG
jgi:hypothetical protein